MRHEPFAAAEARRVAAERRRRGHDTASRREHARRLRESLPRAREVVFRRSGHLSNLQEADAYNREVADFCASVDAGAVLE